LGTPSSKSLRGQPGQALVLRVGRLSRRRPQGQSDLPAFGSVPLLEPTAGDDWKRVMNHDPHAQFDLVEAKRRGALQRQGLDLLRRVRCGFLAGLSATWSAVCRPLTGGSVHLVKGSKACPQVARAPGRLMQLDPWMLGLVGLGLDQELGGFLPVPGLRKRFGCTNHA
jgi:hypothetical protein